MASDPTLCARGYITAYPARIRITYRRSPNSSELCLSSEAVSLSRSKDLLSVVLTALIVVVLIDQARFLFVYPVADTGMWFGDETWTMLTVHEIARSGIARIPEALGSSLAHSNGLVNG